MGGGGSKLGPKEVLIIGLDNAGKTTFFQQLQNHFKLSAAEIDTTPTIGCNQEAVRYKSLKMNVVDMGGRESSRSLWKHNYATADGIVFLVDGTDADRLPEVAKEIKNMAADPDLNPNAAVLVIVNKQDVHGCMRADRVKKDLELDSTLPGRSVHVQAASVASATGIAEGMDWLLDTLKKQPKKSSKGKEKS
eukprot:TRINITY_DN328_c0_g1_i1.p1 TRINITY_DN328_c0_g1~~TRINITY_DN328_c0_g1_i1.p1  ORF type:complete len:192 (-),score=42.02 TRINITY_DN328_c0_g1_i1:488-1063(-)